MSGAVGGPACATVAAVRRLTRRRATRPRARRAQHDRDRKEPGHDAHGREPGERCDDEHAVAEHVGGRRRHATLPSRRASRPSTKSLAAANTAIAIGSVALISITRDVQRCQREAQQRQRPRQPATPTGPPSSIRPRVPSGAPGCLGGVHSERPCSKKLGWHSSSAPSAARPSTRERASVPAAASRSAAKASASGTPVAGIAALVTLLVLGGGFWFYYRLAPTPARGLKPGEGPPPAAMGGAPAGAPGAAAATTASGAPHPQIELPDDIKKYIEKVETEAKAKPKDVAAWETAARVQYRASRLDPSYVDAATASYEHLPRSTRRTSRVCAVSATSPPTSRSATRRSSSTRSTST